MRQIRLYRDSSSKSPSRYVGAANLVAKVLTDRIWSCLAVCMSVLAVGCAMLQKPVRRTDSQHTVSFESPTGVPILECFVNNDGPVPFVLDTGAAYTLIDETYADTTGVISHGPYRKSVQGYRMQTAILQELRIGPMVIENVEVELLDFADFGKRGIPPGVGILGYPFLKQFELTVDFSAATVTFRKNLSRQLSRKFSQALGLVIIPVVVEGQGPFNFILDTGANGMPGDRSHVDPRVLDALDPPLTELHEVQLSIPQGPSGHGRVRTVDYHEKTRAYILEHYGIAVYGTVGWELLHDWVVTINYPTETFSLEKYNGPPLPKPEVALISPDISHGIPSDIRQIVIAFNVPMLAAMLSVTTDFPMREARWLDGMHLVVTPKEVFEPGESHTISLSGDMRSARYVQLDELTISFKVQERRRNSPS